MSHDAKNNDNSDDKRGDSLWNRLKRCAEYCARKVWRDNSDSWRVRAVKIANLSVRSFMDRNLQMRAASLTYDTVLALVPALAMLFAIGRGFGFQALLQSQLMNYFPAQRQAIASALTYVENYLSQASQGAFIGVGLLVLLWTLLSLMNNVEDTFNGVWGVTRQRSLVRKITDYTAILLLLPVMMVCTAGLEIFMSDTVQQAFTGNVFSPVARVVLRLVPWVVSWVVFATAFYVIPNTHVSLRNAWWAGVLSGTAFQVLQWLFVTGQVYVSRYNAIYGSFAFLPLLLVWLQLSWLITLAGVAITYAGQNYYRFAHSDQAADIAPAYADELALGVLAVVAHRFSNKEQPLSRNELLRDFELPATLADALLKRLQQAGLVVAIDEEKNSVFMPAYDVAQLTLGSASDALSQTGNAHFISEADKRFASLHDEIEKIRLARQTCAADTPLHTLV